MCAFPFVLVQFLEQDEGEGPDDTDDFHEEQGTVAISSKLILHDHLKAQAMRFKKPTQIIRPSTYDERNNSRLKQHLGTKDNFKDEATRAWNLYTALYYKAGGTPWRLAQTPSELSACYVV